jgi:hypothetical protein
LPILIIAGDDYQLASMYQGALQCLTSIGGNKMTEKGRQCFRECARTVFELFRSRRIADDNADDKAILGALRIGEEITDDQVDKLLSLHLDAIKSKHGPEVVKEIEEKSVFLFWTNEKRIQHNIQKLIEMNGPDNPTSISKIVSAGGGKHGKPVNSHFKGDFPGFCLICDGCKVAVSGCNFNPIWGIHNGACGTVEERVYAPGTNPNKDNFTLYVVVDFRLYDGPAWDQDNPKVTFKFVSQTIQFVFFLTIFHQLVPIPIITVRCSKNCCTRTFLPLDLAFARTIHKFQGLSAGPVDEGKIPNMHECIVCDPDIQGSECRATGLLHTGTSRATTLGDKDGLNSAIYFQGPNFTKSRIQNVTKKTNSQYEFENVKRRKIWVNHLKSNTVKPKKVNTNHAQKIFAWSKTKITKQHLKERIDKCRRSKNQKY